MSGARAQRLPSLRPTAAPDTEKGRHLRLVEPERRHRVRPRVVVALVLTALFMVLLALASFHTLLVANQQRLDGLERRVAGQQDQYEKLRLEATRLEAPDRIVAEATDRLGMVPPEATKYLTPSGAAWAEIAGEATAANAEDAAASTPQAEQSRSAPNEGPNDWSQVKPHLRDRP